MARRVREDRHETQASILSVDEALDQALAVPKGPVIIADVTNNAGGAPSDSTSILRRMVKRGRSDVAPGYVWDLDAIFICRDGGVGAAFSLRVDWRAGPTSGDPIDIPVTVKAIIPDHFESGIGLHWPLGPSVWVEEPKRLDIVPISNRNQAITLAVSPILAWTFLQEARY